MQLQTLNNTNSNSNKDNKNNQEQQEQEQEPKTWLMDGSGPEVGGPPGHARGAALQIIDQIFKQTHRKNERKSRQLMVAGCALWGVATMHNWVNLICSCRSNSWRLPRCNIRQWGQTNEKRQVVAGGAVEWMSMHKIYSVMFATIFLGGATDK